VSHPNRIRRIRRLPRFEKAYKGLPPDIQAMVDDAIRDIVKEYIPAARRMNQLGGYKNPKVFAVHVTPNHSHKMSFEIDGDLATLRNVDTHKAIDKSGRA